MTENRDPFKKVFKALGEIDIPTEEQKQRMLNSILENVREEQSFWERLKGYICVYPWRFAFGVSAVQAAVFTMIFGTRYTNLFLRAFGG